MNFGKTLEEISLKATKARNSSVVSILTDDIALRSLAKRANAKACYIDLLQKYYEGKQSELLNPESLWTEINKERDLDSPLLELKPTVRLEKLDPAHRDFEFFGLGNDPGPASLAATHATNWYKAIRNGGTQAPLWLYLEETDFSLDKSLAKEVSVVPYLAETQMKQVFSIKPSQDGSHLQQARLDNDAYNWERFDAQWANSKLSGKGGARKSLAFIWSAGKELFADLHNPEPLAQRPWNRFHHSSFNGGGIVLCAGMISARNGMVTYINNNSGHYAPAKRHLQAFVRHLNDGRLFDASAEIEDFGDPKACSVADYLADVSPVSNALG